MTNLCRLWLTFTGWRVLWFEVLPPLGGLLLSVHWRFMVELAKGNVWFYLQFWWIRKRELQGPRNCAGGQEMGRWPATEVRKGANTVAAGCGILLLRVRQNPGLDGLETSSPKCRMPTAATRQCPQPDSSPGGQKNRSKWAIRQFFLHHTFKGIATSQELSWTNRFDSA